MTWAPKFTFSVTWDNITGKPLNYPTTWGLVEGKPSTFPSTWDTVSDKPAQATRWPTWGEVTGKPSTFTPSSHTHTIANVTGLQTELDAKFDSPSGTTSQYIRGNGSLATFPNIPAGTVTSVTGGNGLSGSVTSSGTISLGTPGTLSGSTTNEVTTSSHTHALSANLSAWDGVSVGSKADSARTITAGSGLSGGGTLAANRTISLGTPGTLSGTTTNNVTASSHTHALSANLKAWDGVSPDSKANTSHTHTWSEVNNKPVTATRWPTWGEVTGKPANITLWAEIDPNSKADGSTVTALAEDIRVLDVAVGDTRNLVKNPTPRTTVDPWEGNNGVSSILRVTGWLHPTEDRVFRINFTGATSTATAYEPEFHPVVEGEVIIASMDARSNGFAGGDFYTLGCWFRDENGVQIGSSRQYSIGDISSSAVWRTYQGRIVVPAGAVEFRVAISALNPPVDSNILVARISARRQSADGAILSSLVDTARADIDSKAPVANPVFEGDLTVSTSLASGGVIVERRNQPFNSSIEYKTTGGSVWAGYGNNGTIGFSVGGSSILTGSNTWFKAEDGAAYIFQGSSPREVFHEGNFNPSNIPAQTGSLEGGGTLASRQLIANRSGTDWNAGIQYIGGEGTFICAGMGTPGVFSIGGGTDLRDSARPWFSSSSADTTVRSSSWYPLVVDSSASSGAAAIRFVNGSNSRYFGLGGNGDLRTSTSVQFSSGDMLLTTGNSARVFVQSGDPGSNASTGDLWVW